MRNLRILLDASRCPIWFALIFIAVTAEVTALYYQYVLEYLPCVLCIQTRILFFVFLLLAIFGFITKKQSWARVFNLTLLLVTSIALINRSWVLLGTERGFIIGDCSFSLGLPTWLAFEKWVPFIFKVHTSCGYTPEMLFGFTMAEALLLLAILLSLTITGLLLLNFSKVR